jgi:hypothetical protein
MTRYKSKAWLAAERVFKTITPLERADNLLAYKEQRQAERQRMLELRRQRLARDEAGE